MDITQLPFPKLKSGKFITDIVEHVLSTDLYLEQWIVPAGTRVRLQTTADFGIVVLDKNCQDKRGFEIPRRLFKY